MLWLSFIVLQPNMSLFVPNIPALVIDVVVIVIVVTWTDE